MDVRRSVLASCTVLFALCSLSRPAAADGTLDQILARTKAAMGGTALERVTSIEWRQRVTFAGISGTGLEIDDLRTGSSVQRQNLGPLTNATGFDGRVAWEQDQSGDAWPVGDYEALHAAATGAYLTSWSFLYPGRWPGEISYHGVSAGASGRYYELYAQPKGGFPVDISIDAATYLVAREVTRIPYGRNTTTVLSDYRTVDGAVLPFASTTTQQNNATQIQASSASLNVPVAGKFALPVTTVTDASIAGGSTVVPFKLINNHIYLQARVDGKGPFLFVFDSGGRNILTPETAALVGASSSGAYQAGGAGAGQVMTGFTKVASIQVGGATLRDQMCAVLPLGDVMKAIEGVRIQGMIGYETFRRFVTTIDYHDSRITFRPATATGAFGTAVPFLYDDTAPLVFGRSGKLTGQFLLDTGNRGSLDFYTPFVIANRLPYTNVHGITGYGIGGPSYGSLGRTPLFYFGTVPVRDVVTTYSQDTSGATTEPGTAGNIGGGLLKRFTVTFAYRRQVLYLQPNASYAKRESYDRSGLVLVQTKAGLRVIDALTNTPAAQAGIKAGDVIVAVNGAPASSVGLLLLRTMLRSAPGTQVKLALQRAGVTRTVTITLRDYV
jgi:hypothetical protein